MFSKVDMDTPPDYSGSANDSAYLFVRRYNSAWQAVFYSAAKVYSSRLTVSNVLNFKGNNLLQVYVEDSSTTDGFATGTFNYIILYFE